MLFIFVCIAPTIIAGKKKYINKFYNIGSDIGLLFQITDDLLDLKGDSKKLGKKTKKDTEKGKATLISLLGYEKTIVYSHILKNKVFKSLNDFGKKADYLKKTINFILERGQ